MQEHEQGGVGVGGCFGGKFGQDGAGEHDDPLQLEYGYDPEMQALKSDSELTLKMTLSLYLYLLYPWHQRGLAIEGEEWAA